MPDLTGFGSARKLNLPKHTSGHKLRNYWRNESRKGPQILLRASDSIPSQQDDNPHVANVSRYGFAQGTEETGRIFQQQVCTGEPPAVSPSRWMQVIQVLLLPPPPPFLVHNMPE